MKHSPSRTLLTFITFVCSTLLRNKVNAHTAHTYILRQLNNARTYLNPQTGVTQRVERAMQETHMALSVAPTLSASLKAKKVRQKRSQTPKVASFDAIPHYRVKKGKRATYQQVGYPTAGKTYWYKVGRRWVKQIQPETDWLLAA